MRSKHLTTLLLAATLLSGCTMIPHFKRPAPPVAEEWPFPVEQAEGQETSIPAASIAWQEFFKSSALQTAITTALEHNRDLRIAALNVEAARAQYGIQRSNLFPSITGDLEGTKQRVSQNVPINNGSTSFINEYYTAEVSLSYGLDFFGRLRSLSRAAQEEFLATEEARKAIQVSLIAETANAWLQLQADRAILRLTRDTFDAQRRSFELIQARFEKGVSSSLELAQARIPLETARVNYALYSRLVEQDKNALAVLLGTHNAEALMEDIPLENVELMETLPIGLPSEVLLLRPDIRQAEHELLAANANIGAARAAFFPSISLTASIGEASGELDDLFTSSAGSIWSFMPRVSIPIFQGGRNFSNLFLSQANRDIAVAQYEKAIQTAFREVADELAARATLGQQLKAQTQLVEASQSAYDSSRARYDQGVDSFLAVLDAQRSLYSAQQQRIEIEKQRLTNLVNLYKVLGGGQTAEMPKKSSEATKEFEDTDKAGQAE